MAILRAARGTRELLLLNWIWMIHWAPDLSSFCVMIGLTMLAYGTWFAAAMVPSRWLRDAQASCFTTGAA